MSELKLRPTNTKTCCGKIKGARLGRWPLQLRRILVGPVFADAAEFALIIVPCVFADDLFPVGLTQDLPAGWRGGRRRGPSSGAFCGDGFCRVFWRSSRPCTLVRILLAVQGRRKKGFNAEDTEIRAPFEARGKQSSRRRPTLRKRGRGTRTATSKTPDAATASGAPGG
jgi:hypothetical protein